MMHHYPMVTKPSTLLYIVRYCKFRNKLFLSFHMASTPYLRVFLWIFLTISMLCSNPKSHILEKERNYDKWISWHVHDFRERSSLQAEEMIRTPEPGTEVVDKILRNAEKKKTTITICQNGTGNFKTITEAIATIPLHNSRRVILSIKGGIYRENVVIPRTMSFITFLGDSDSTNQPTITANNTASTTGRTYQSATVGVNADYFVAINIKFENTVAHDIGSKGSQAVALRISGTKAAFHNCSFYGSQDTLYDHKGLHYFKNCFIQGSVDFIFGYGRSLYEDCTLNSIAKNRASLTAQKRSNASLSSGFSFKGGKITGTGWVYLGRAWGDYSRVVFSYTYMDNTVNPQGWNDWGDHNRDSSVYYGEYMCTGPGANFSERVPWARTLTDEEVKPFLGTYYIDGDSWLIEP